MGGADKPRLLHAGVEPLRAFAYQLTPNQQVVRESDLTMRITNGAEIKDRRMKIRFEVRVRKGEDAGNLLEASMLDGSDDSVGSWVRMTQASNGSLRRVVPDPPKPYLCEDVESALATVVTRSIVQLPPDPIGVGARWQHVSSRDQGLIQLLDLVTSELLSVEGDVLTISSSATAFALPSRDLVFRKVDAKATWRSTIDLRVPLPLRVENNGDSRIELVLGQKIGLLRTELESMSTVRPRTPADPPTITVPACEALDAKRLAECSTLGKTISDHEKLFGELDVKGARLLGPTAKFEAFSAEVTKLALTDSNLVKHRAEYQAMLLELMKLLRGELKGEAMPVRLKEVMGVNDRVMNALLRYCKPKPADQGAPTP